MSDNRVPMTVRLLPEDRALLYRSASEVGLEASAAMRQVVELMLSYVRAGHDLLDATYAIKTALKPRVRVQAKMG